MEWSLLSLFITTFFFVSLTPGMCMTLALTLGMTLGLRRTLWMMLGELVGVGLVATSAAMGVAAVMLQFPALFWLLKGGGALYLAYLGYELWHSRGRMALNRVDDEGYNIANIELISQGFITAIANPKGWAFFIALLPPFIDEGRSLMLQLPLLIAVILSLEFVCLLAYASGGRSLGRLLAEPRHVRTLNRVAGTLMIGVALWLLLG